MAKPASIIPFMLLHVISQYEATVIQTNGSAHHFHGGTINCPDGQPCSIYCDTSKDGGGICELAIVNCPTDAQCDLYCGPYHFACRGATIHCPLTADCNVYCTARVEHGAGSVICDRIDPIWSPNGQNRLTCDGAGTEMCSYINGDHSFPVPPPDEPMILNCEAPLKCAHSNIICPSNADCRINCHANTACANAIITWSVHGNNILDCDTTKTDPCLNVNLPPSHHPTTHYPSKPPIVLPTEHPTTHYPTEMPTIDPVEMSTADPTINPFIVFIPTKHPTLTTIEQAMALVSSQAGNTIDPTINPFVTTNTTVNASTDTTTTDMDAPVTISHGNRHNTSVSLQVVVLMATAGLSLICCAGGCIVYLAYKLYCQKHIRNTKQVVNYVENMANDNHKMNAPSPNAPDVHIIEAPSESDESNTRNPQLQHTIQQRNIKRKQSESEDIEEMYRNGNNRENKTEGGSTTAGMSTRTKGRTSQGTKMSKMDENQKRKEGESDGFVCNQSKQLAKGRLMKMTDCFIVLFVARNSTN